MKKWGGLKLIGIKVKQYLDENGIKYSFLSEKIGIPMNVLSPLLNGKRKMSVEEYFLICNALELPVDTFEPEEEVWKEYRYDYNTGRKSEYVKYVDGREEIFVLIDWNYQGISSGEEILRGKKGVILQVVLIVRLVVLNVNETFWAISLTSGK